MRIFKRGDVYWFQFHGTRQSLGVTDRQAAEAAAREVQRRYADPSYASARTITLGEACEAFLIAQSSGGIRKRAPAEGTLEMYGYHLGHFARLLGASTPLTGIDAGAVDRYAETRRREAIGKRVRRPVTAATISKELGTLRGVLRLALRRGWYHRPLEAVMPARMATDYVPLTRALTEAQIAPFLAAFADEPRAAMCAYLIGLGADWCAARRATVEDFHLQPGSVLIKGTKNPRRWAYVPVVPPFEGLAHRAHRYLEVDGSFPAWGNARRDMAAACLRAGLPRVTPRDLRRTHGRVLRARGVPPALIGGMLRHVDGRMAERVYGQLEPDDLGRLVTAAALGGVPRG